MIESSKSRRQIALDVARSLMLVAALLFAGAGCGDGGSGGTTVLPQSTGSESGAGVGGPGAGGGGAGILATNPDGGTTTTGQGLDVEITPGAGTTPPVVVGSSPIQFSASATLSASPPLPVNFLYILDTSGSMRGAVTDANGDGTSDTSPGGTDNCDAELAPNKRIDAACFGLIALNTSLGHPVNVQVGLIAFGTLAGSPDVSPAAGNQFFTAPDTDSDGDGISDIAEVVHSVNLITNNTFSVYTPTGNLTGNTDYHRALVLMNQRFSAQPAGDKNIAAFISDGNPSSNNVFLPDVQLAHARGTIIHTFAIGDSFPSPPCAVGRPLRQISDGTGGTCTVVDDPGTLQQALPDALTTRITRLELTVNGPIAAFVEGNAQAELHLDDVDVSALIQDGDNVIQAIGTAKDGTVVTAETILPALSQVTALVDIKPGSDVNPINLKSKGKVPVAILGSADFAVSTVDASTLALAGSPVVVNGNGKHLMVSYEDVNGDGFVDLLFHVETQGLSLAFGDAAAAVTGQLLSGIPLVGSDTVRIVH